MDVEVAELKTNVNNLSQCLHALLKRIEQLEHSAPMDTECFYYPNKGVTLKTVNEAVDGLLSTKETYESDLEPDVQVVCNEMVTEDPETGVKKRTVVTERVVTTKSFHTIPVDDGITFSNENQYGTMNSEMTLHDEPRKTNTWIKTEPNDISDYDNNNKMLSQAMVKNELISDKEMRTIDLNQNPFGDVFYDRIGNQIIITRVKSGFDAANDIRVGDIIVEVNGIPTSQIKHLMEFQGKIRLKMMPAPLHCGPSVYYRAKSNYNGSRDPHVPKNLNALNLEKNEIIQVFSKDSNWIQGRKVNDLNQSGLCPVDIAGERMSLLTPYNRRVLVLLGVPGVGRRTLKTMFLDLFPQYFTTAIPYTSRAAKSNELEGREYYFRTKEEVIKRIQERDMIEWGEFDQHLYGTSLETIRSCIRSGRICVLDCAPRALQYLYNGEFMPFVVFIALPEMSELQETNKYRLKPYTKEQLKAYSQENSELMESVYADRFDLILVNRNVKDTFNSILEELNKRRNEIQWVPDVWFCKQ